MSVIKKEIYSNLGFYQALAPQDVASGNTNGLTVDLAGHDACVFAVNVGACTNSVMGSATEYFQLKLEHGLASELGVSVWSEVYPSQMVHSVVGMAGAYSTLNSGVFQSIASVTDISANTGKLFVVGYKGPRRYVRIAVSAAGAPSTVSMAAVAVLGGAGDWPVSEAVGD